MAQLTYHNASRYRYPDAANEQPTVTEDTIRDKRIRQLARKQLNTHVTLAEAKKAKSFLAASIQEPITDRFGGLLSLAEFRAARTAADVTELLRSCDLSDADVQFLLSQPSASVSDAYLRSRLDFIDAKIAKRQQELSVCSDEHFAGSIPLSRHAYEEECGKMATSAVADKLTACLVHVEPDLNPLYGSDHPIHQLPTLARELFPAAAAPPRLKKTKKRKCPVAVSECEEVDAPCGQHNSLWDVKCVRHNVQLTDNTNCRDDTTGGKRVSCPRAPFVYAVIDGPSRKTDYSKPFVLTARPQDLLTEQDIRSNCVPLSALKEQFVSYERGVPSSVLFVKNISHNLSPTLLAAIFGQFEPKEGPKNSYRLLKGKMRGQAFVTLKSPEVADRAISMCNGYLIENKPMVISFGKGRK